MKALLLTLALALPISASAASYEFRQLTKSVTVSATAPTPPAPTYIYATLDPATMDSSIALDASKLSPTVSNYQGWASVLGTQQVSSGKWYWEWTFNSAPPSQGPWFRIGVPDAFYENDGSLARAFWSNGTKVTGSMSPAPGDTIGVALDMDAKQLHFYLNGVKNVVVLPVTASAVRPFFAIGVANMYGVFNFGQNPFKYAPPSGFKAGLYE